MEVPKECAQDWRAICEAASQEKDPERLKWLIAELIKLLEERRKVPASQTHPTEL